MKVGDYVRIKTLSGQGGIAKLEKVDDICITDNGAVDKNNIIKSSLNIIDLIEVGDYVNGYYVDKITDIDTGLQVLCNFDLNLMKWIPLENIDVWYSIVTKEQFEAMEYKLEE